MMPVYVDARKSDVTKLVPKGARHCDAITIARKDVREIAAILSSRRQGKHSTDTLGAAS